MDAEDIKYIQRRINPMGLDVHPSENALVVNYEVEASLVGDLGDTMLEESKECQKIIRLKSLNQSSDIDSLAQEIVRKSGNLIAVSQIEEVKRLLSYLRTRKDITTETATGTKMENLRPKTAAPRMDSHRSNRSPSNTQSLDPTKDLISTDLLKELKLGESADAEPSINQLDEYTELLYEELQDKVKGSALLYKLAQSADNLSELTTNEILLCALARVLREDGRKSLDLATLIVGIFATFSRYTDFHPVISQYKFGSLCFDVIQWELSREESWFRELTEIQAAAVYQTKPGSASMASSLIMMASNSSTISAPAGMGHMSPTFSCSPEDYEKSLKKYQILVRKQNQLLRVAFFLLLNLSEDRKVEMKMINKGIVLLLLKTLEREVTPEFFLLVITFLKKLSVFVENKNQMSDLGVIEKLYSLFSTSSALSSYQLVNLLLNLLLNLSFDINLRIVMIKVGFLGKLVQLLSKDRLSGGVTNEQIILRILYQMSRDDKAKALFNFTFASGMECIELIITKLLKLTETTSGPPRSARNSKPQCLMELVSLAINLAINRRNAQIMSEEGRLEKLLKRAVALKSSEDAEILNILLLKLIRNISQHDDPLKMLFLDHVEPLLKLAIGGHQQNGDEQMTIEGLRNGNDEDLTEILEVECLGILGNLMNLPQIDWLTLFKKYHVFDWMKVRLKPGSSCEDDLILEIAIFLGTACSQLECATHLISCDLIKVLIDLLNAKQEDDEIVLQVIFLFHVLIKHSSSREYIIKDSQVPAYLIDLMSDKNVEIKRVCGSTLDIIAEVDPDWGKKIQMEKFKSHNKQWLEMVQSQQNVDYFDDFSDLYNQVPDDQSYNFLVKSDFASDAPEPEPSSFSSNHLKGPLDLVPSRGVSLPRPSFSSESPVASASSRPHTAYKKRSNSKSRIPLPCPNGSSPSVASKRRNPSTSPPDPSSSKVTPKPMGSTSALFSSLYQLKYQTNLSG